MVQLKGVYNHGDIIFEEKIASSGPQKVIVTFLDEPSDDEQLSSYSFSRSRNSLKNVSAIFSAAVIEERRNEL
ncbi:hypothetical protein [Mucilaginibacter ginkgonis]|uniref:Uncharacterized protein n=1 Tax=Mucilaginibacter ginkgonis TaxID=2682091 RepID=A0A6I4IP71_9SPHI|nr:hypothetical protein [Mucilaginibacter ginkgonis]QQL49245.1 hypothetical protein GO620_013845 [Mucilaginibacter ginkgonis]